MSNEDEIKKAELRGYSRGYAAGVKRGKWDVEEQQRKAVRSIKQAVTTKAPEKDLDAVLLDCLAKEIDKAAKQGRIHLWEKAGHSIIDYIANDYRARAESTPPETK